VNRAALDIPFLSASLLLDRAMQSCEKLAPEAKARFWALAVEAFGAAVAGSLEMTGTLQQALEAEKAAMGAEMISIISMFWLVSSHVP